MTIIVIVAIAAGTTALLRSLWTLFTAIDSRKWPSTEGVVVASDEETLVEPKLSYRFTVNGQGYVGNRRVFGKAGWKIFFPMIKEYRQGTSVTVRYNPEKPSEAVLEPGVSWWLFSTLVFEIAFIGVGIVFLRSIP